MKPARSILLVATTLALFISACSQPEGLQTPNVKPQFGTTDRDTNPDVAIAPNGGTYVLSEQFGYLFPDSFYYSKVILSRYSSSGTLLWTKDVDELEVDTSTSDYPYLIAGTVERDASDNAYVLSGEGLVYQDNGTITYHSVYVYNPNGTLKRNFEVGESGYTFGGDEEAYPHMAVDASGNTYIGIAQAIPDGFGISTVNLLRKYSPTGTLLWERNSSVGAPTGVALATDGIIYLSGDKGLARYTSTGSVSWKKSGDYLGVTTSGSSVLSYTPNKVFAFSSSGQAKWTRFIGGLKSVIIQDLSGDVNGNLFVSGKYQVNAGNWNAFARKFNASGASQWTKTYGTPQFDDAQGVATLNGREIYVTGVTKGSLAHPHRGEEDGYIRKLNASGNPLWTR